MRANEFLIERKSMSSDDWSREGEKINYNTLQKIKIKKYTDPFLLGIMKGMIYSFASRPTQTVRGRKGSSIDIGKEFLGKIISPLQLKTSMEKIIKMKNLDDRKDALSNLTFSVAVVDDESNEVTGTIIDSVRLSNIFKDERIKGGLKPNMGNFSEALLGCAVAARFSKRGKEITVDNIINMGELLATHGGIAQLTAGKDKLQFKISIPYMDEKAFYTWVEGGLNEEDRANKLREYQVPPAIITLIEHRAKTAAEYANKSKRVDSAIKSAAADPGKNKVDVISDGGEKENQSITKVDLKIMIDGNETAKRLLSIKAGPVAQFGQVTGVNFEHVNEFFKTAASISIDEKLRKKFYDIPKGARKVDYEKQYNFENGTKAAFNDAFRKISVMAKADQANLVQNIYQGLLHHLTRNEEGVEMVILDPNSQKAFTELSFGKEFETAIKQLHIIPTITMKTGYTISIYGFPIGSVAKLYIPARKDAQSKLVDLTAQYKDGSIRNMLGMGGLLKHIADIENYQEQHPVEPTEKLTPTKKVTDTPTQQEPVTKKVELKTTKPLKTIQPVVTTAKVDPQQKAKLALATGGKSKQG